MKCPNCNDGTSLTREADCQTCEGWAQICDLCEQPLRNERCDCEAEPERDPQDVAREWRVENT